MFQKINQIAMVAFMAIGVLLMVLTMRATPTETGCENCGSIGWFISLAYLLLGLAVVAALSGTVMTAMSNPARLKGSAIGVGVMMALALVCYILASDEVLDSYGDITPTVSRLSGAGLYMFYVLLLGAVGSIVYSSIGKFTR